MTRSVFFYVNERVALRERIVKKFVCSGTLSPCLMIFLLIGFPYWHSLIEDEAHKFCDVGVRFFLLFIFLIFVLQSIPITLSPQGPHHSLV